MLKKYFEKLQSFTHSITEIKEVFVPIMHLIMLIQNYSNYYKSNTNLFIFIRQIYNEIITQRCKYFQGPDLIAKIVEFDLHTPLRSLEEIRETCRRFKLV